MVGSRSSQSAKTREEPNSIMGKHEEINEAKVLTSQLQIDPIYTVPELPTRISKNSRIHCHRLGARTNLIENEQHLISRFTGELQVDPRESKTSTFPMVIRSHSLCSRRNGGKSIEIYNKRIVEISTSKSTLAPQVINKTTAAEKNKEQEKKDDQNNKKKTGEANKKSTNPYNRPFSGTCYRCGQAGYPSNSCPQRKTVAVVDAEEDLNQGSNEEYEEEAELIEADEGDNLSCVLQKILITPKEEHQPHRHSLFKTRCMIQGKICNVIIDSGSSENFVSRKLVTALNPKSEAHPNPYKIGWIKKGGEA